MAENETKRTEAEKEYLLEKLEGMKKTHDDMIDYFENVINEYNNPFFTKINKLH